MYETADILWHRGDVTESGWSIVSKVSAEPRATDFPEVLNKFTALTHAMATRQAALAHVTAMLPASGESISFGIPFSGANTTASVWVEGRDSGRAIDTWVDCIFPNHEGEFGEQLVFVPAQRLKHMGREVIENALADIRGLAMGAAMASIDTILNAEYPSAIAFTTPGDECPGEDWREFMNQFQHLLLQALAAWAGRRDTPTNFLMRVRERGR